MASTICMNFQAPPSSLREGATDLCQSNKQAKNSKERKKKKLCMFYPLGSLGQTVDLRIDSALFVQLMNCFN